MNHLAGNHLAGKIVVGGNVTVAGRYLCSLNRRLSISSELDLLVAEMVSIISAMGPLLHPTETDSPCSHAVWKSILRPRSMKLLGSRSFNSHL